MEVSCPDMFVDDESNNLPKTAAIVPDEIISPGFQEALALPAPQPADALRIDEEGFLDKPQQELADDALARLEHYGNDLCHLIVYPTGGGKTEIGAYLLYRIMTEPERYGMDEFFAHAWLSERTVLRGESARRLEDRLGWMSERSLIADVIDNPPSQRSLVPGRINMLSPQTFMARGENPETGKNYPYGRRPIAYDLGLIADEDFGLIIADEGHHGVANYYGSVLRAWGGPRIGLTATAWLLSARNALGEGRAVKGHHSGPWTTIEYGPEAFNLVGKFGEPGKRLSEIEVLKVDPRLRVSHRNLKKNIMSLDGYDGQSVDDEIARLLALGYEIIHECDRLADGDSILYFCRSKAAAYRVAEMYVELGRKAIAITSETPEDERREALRLLDAGEIDAVTSVDVFGEGVNIPNVSCIAMLRPTQSLTRHRQFLGRGLRIRENNKPLKVLDFASNIYHLGSPLEGWTEMGLGPRINTYSKGKQVETVCPDCEHSCVWSQKTCYMCGRQLSWVCEDTDINTTIFGEDVTLHVPGHHVREWCGRFPEADPDSKTCFEAIQQAIQKEQVRRQEQARLQQAEIRHAKELEYERERQEREVMREEQRKMDIRSKEDRRLRREDLITGVVWQEPAPGLFLADVEDHINQHKWTIVFTKSTASVMANPHNASDNVMTVGSLGMHCEPGDALRYITDRWEQKADRQAPAWNKAGR